MRDAHILRTNEFQCRLRKCYVETKVSNRDQNTRSLEAKNYIFQWCRSGVFIVSFEHISHLILCFHC